MPRFPAPGRSSRRAEGSSRDSPQAVLRAGHLGLPSARLAAKRRSRLSRGDRARVSSRPRGIEDVALAVGEERPGEHCQFGIDQSKFWGDDNPGLDHARQHSSQQPESLAAPSKGDRRLKTLPCSTDASRTSSTAPSPPTPTSPRQRNLIEEQGSIPSHRERTATYGLVSDHPSTIAPKMHYDHPYTSSADHAGRGLG